MKKLYKGTFGTPCILKWIVDSGSLFKTHFSESRISNIERDKD
jgi:hypothetical protein